MILLVLHASYKETLQNNTVICNNRWFTQHFVESHGIGVEQILMKPHYSCVAWLFNYFRLLSWRSVLESNYLEPFFSLYWFRVFSSVKQFTLCRITIWKDWPKHWNSFRSSWCWCVLLDYYCYHCIYIKVNIHLNYIFYFNYYESKLWKSIKNLIASDFQYTIWETWRHNALSPYNNYIELIALNEKKTILTSCCVTV